MRKIVINHPNHKLLTAIIMLIGSFCGPLHSYSNEPTNYKDFTFYENTKKHFCDKNPYDCKFDGSIDNYAMDKFIQEFYSKLESMMFEKGFTESNFGFCKRHANKCYFDHTLGKIKNGTSVVNSRFLITKAYPANGFWWNATCLYNCSDGGDGITFSKFLNSDELNAFCSTKYSRGKPFKKNLRELLSKDPASNKFSDILGVREKKNTKILFEISKEDLFALNPETLWNYGGECVLIDSERMRGNETRVEGSFPN